MIVTFYSFKGGVGRSQLLANLANYLCHYKNKKILLIDWDLEAPGLHHYFGNDFEVKEGLLEFFEEFCRKIRYGGKIPVDQLPSVLKNKDIYITNIQKSQNKSGAIDILPGGNYLNQYYGRLNDFEWYEFYELLDGKRFIEIFKVQLRSLDYDYIFIDSRTGFSDYQGICNIQIPDINVIVVGPSYQNFEGSNKAIRRILESPYTKEYKKSPTIIIPILSRLDRNDEESWKWFNLFRDEYSATIQKLFKHLIPYSYAKKTEKVIAELKNTYIEDTLLEYKIQISFGEKLLFKHTKKEFGHTSLEKQFQEIAEVIEFIKNRNEEVLFPQTNSKFISALLGPIPKFLTFIPHMDTEEVIGRENDLKELYSRLDKSIGPVLLNGPSGIGKTTLAKCYVQQHQDKYQYIAWIAIQAKNQESRTELLHTLVNNEILFDSLRLKFNSRAGIEKRRKLILKALQDLPGKKLLVIDNLNIIKGEINDLLPQQPDWEVLITSRRQIKDYETYQLDILDKEAAKNLFVKYHKEYVDPGKVEEFLELANCHPMTIKLFAQMLQRYFDLDLPEIIDRLKNRKKITLDEGDDNYKEAFDTLQNLKEAYEVADLESREQEILLNFSLLPNKEIKGKRLLELFQVPKTERRKFANTLHQLVQKGWLVHYEDSQSFQCHQIIQSFIRRQLKPNYSKCRLLIDSIAKQLDLKEGYELSEKRPWMSYASHILNHIEEDKEVILTELWLNLGLLQSDFANYPQSVESFENAILMADSIDNDDLEQKAVINLNLVYQALGEYPIAIDNLETYLESTIKKFGRSSPKIPNIQINLSKLLSKTSNYQKAIQLLESAEQTVMATAENRSKASEIVEIKTELAGNYIALSNYTKAENTLKSALELEVQNDGVDSPKAISINKQLANLYLAFGKTSKAKTAVRHHLDVALQGHIQLSGENELDAIDRKISLATACFNAQDFEKARDLLETALKESLKIYTNVQNHPKIIEIKLNLANVYVALGEINNGIIQLQAIVSLEKKLYGSENIKIAERQLNLGRLLREGGDYKTAQETFIEAIDLYEKEHAELGEYFTGVNPRLAEARAGLADVYKQLGNFKLAENWLLKAIELNEMLFGSNHARIGRNRRDLGRLYLDMSERTVDKNRIKALQKKALKEFETALTIFDDDSPELNDVKRRIDYIKTLLKWDA